jgi:hypothetical protein
MNASTVISTQAPGEDPHRWLLLIHQIPPKPDYFRVKVRRRLQRMGAIPLKNSVYVLPKSEDALEDFQWLLREVVGDGGEATLCEASLVEGLTSGELEQMFQAERDGEYAEMARAARELGGNTPMPLEAEIARLKQRLAEAGAVDFFHASGRREAEDAITQLEARLHGSSGRAAAMKGRAGTMDGGNTWVTREGVKVDRIGSAWLIRRFIDPNARFKFVTPKGYRATPGERRFDMFEAEFTHEGENCTFETLLARFEIRDRALRCIADIVHDIDCKEDRYGREETAGIASLIRGITHSIEADAARLERGAAIFDDLYASFSRRKHA